MRMFDDLNIDTRTMCPICGNKFHANSSTDKYCSAECRNKAVQIKRKEYNATAYQRRKAKLEQIEKE